MGWVGQGRGITGPEPGHWTRWLIAFAAMGLGCGSAVPEPGVARPPAVLGKAPPRLAIEPAGRVELGELGPGQPRLQRYTFSNLSGAPIALRVFDLSPGITVAGPALERPIPPRASLGLELRVDPDGWVGPQLRNVRLGTDDPEQGEYYLPVRMTVRPDLTVDGTRRSFGDVGVQESPLVLFSFLRETGAPLRLELACAPPPYLECEIRESGPRASLACVLRPGRIRPGMALGLERLRVKSNAPLQHWFDLYLEWRIHHAIEATPPRVVFLSGAQDALELKLKSRNGTPFRILAAELEGEGFQLGEVSPRSAPEHTLGIRRRGAAPARAMLVLRCSGMDEPLRVPLVDATPAPEPRPDLDEGVMVVPSQPD